MALTQLIGGPFLDSAGNVVANGTLILEPSQDSQLTGSQGQVSGGKKITINLDSTGNVSTTPPQYAWPTDEMVPTGCSYTGWVYTAEGELVWGPNYNLLIPSGTTFNVDTWTPPLIGMPYPTVNELTLATNGVDNPDQHLLNLVAGTGVSISDDGNGDILIKALFSGSAGYGGIYYSSSYATLQDMLDAAGEGNHCYIVPGTYVITQSLHPYNGQLIEGGTNDKIGGSGVVIQQANGNAIWSFENPDAGNTSGSPATNGRRSLTVRNITFDISTNSSSLGAIRVKGMSSCLFEQINVYSNNNSAPAITIDGSNYANNNGCYDNCWVNLGLYDNASRSSATGVYITGDTSQNAGGNQNAFFGGNWQRYGIPILIDCGDGNSFTNVDLEDWVIAGIKLTSAGSHPGYASNNLFIQPRLESAATTGAYGVWFDKAAVDNQVFSPYHSGLYVYTYDTTTFGAANMIFNSYYSPSATPAGGLPEFLFTNKDHDCVVGINRHVDQTKFPQIGLDTTGSIAFDQSLYTRCNGTFQLFGQSHGGTPYSIIRQGGFATDSVDVGSFGNVGFSNGGGTWYLEVDITNFLTKVAFSLTPITPLGTHLGTQALPWYDINFGEGGANKAATLIFNGTSNKTFTFPSGSGGEVAVIETTASSASGGSASLPSNPVGFLVLDNSGSPVKVPYYT
jgi:hypothetical protein